MKKWEYRQHGGDAPKYYLLKSISPDWFGVVYKVDARWTFTIGIRGGSETYRSTKKWKSVATTKTKALLEINNKICKIN